MTAKNTPLEHHREHTKNTMRGLQKHTFKAPREDREEHTKSTKRKS
jgi:hypothetical protein